jgi:hypothetical protein
MSGAYFVKYHECGIVGLFGPPYLCGKIRERCGGGSVIIIDDEEKNETMEFSGTGGGRWVPDGAAGRCNG